MNLPDSKRPYNSARRRQQARQTRRQILSAAGELFDQRGYAGATIEAIAAQAGVSTETVYSIFGSKAGILRDLVSVTVVGDDDELPLLERPEIQSGWREPHPPALFRNFAANMHAIMTRMSPVFALLRVAAKTDPEIAALRERVLAGRLAGMGLMLDMLARLAPLRPGLTFEEARATVFTLSSAEVFDILTRDMGWSREQYIDWLAGSFARLLLP